MEYHTKKESSVAIRVFELGLKLFPDNVEYVVQYLQFLLSINDDTSELPGDHADIRCPRLV
jgi:cleavage stimulation factor subunit 3